ncbi:MAG: hypothetical protein AAGF04_02320 [Chlamydiota bacterium]
MRWVSLFLPFFLFSAPIGNPFMPGMLREELFSLIKIPIHVRVGYEGNFVFDRYLDQYQTGFGSLEKYEIYTNSGRISCDIFDRISLFGTAGSGRIDANFPFSSGPLKHRAVLGSDEELFWSVGGNVLLLDWRLFALGIGLCYSRLCPKISHLSVDGVGYPTEDGSLHYREWQANVGFSYEMDFLVPYIGVKYTSAKSTAHLPYIPDLFVGESQERFWRSRRHVGLYLGSSITSKKSFALTIEARLIDEEAVTVFAAFRF